MIQRPELDQPALVVDESWPLEPAAQARTRTRLRALDAEMRRASREELRRRHQQEREEDCRRVADERFDRHPEQATTFTTADGTLVRQAVVTHCAGDLVAPGERIDPWAMRTMPPAPTAP